MQTKLIGAIFIIAGCSAAGFLIAANYLKEERFLREIESIILYMETELQYRLTPLPSLCRNASQEAHGALTAVLRKLSNELDAQISPDVGRCMARAVAATAGIPPRSKEILELLGGNLGKFDIEGQLKGLASVKSECTRRIELLDLDRDHRLRNYRTLGVCAGTALAVLLL